jgi:hypothetical protein
MPCVRQPRTYVNQANTEKTGSLIQENHCITGCELAEIVRISVSAVKIIIHDELNFISLVLVGSQSCYSMNKR